MPYMHGIRIQENPTSVPTPVFNQAGVTIAFGTAPINLSSNPDKAVNQLILCNSFAEARDALGYSDDYENYTLCQVMDAYFKAFTVGPVVLCNVLDPKKHIGGLEGEKDMDSSFKRGGENGTVKAKEMTPVDNQIIIDELGVMPSSVHVTIVADHMNTPGAQIVPVSGSGSVSCTLQNCNMKNYYDLTLGEHYLVEVDAYGRTIITMLVKPGEGDVSAHYYVSAKKIDPSKVTSADIIGSYNSETGVSTGLELVDDVYQKFKLTPGLIIAPGWSHIPAVGTSMAAKCVDIGDMFRCECVVDINSGQDNTTKGGPSYSKNKLKDQSTYQALKYTDVEKIKNDAGYINEHMICVWPQVMYSGHKMAMSAMYAALCNYLDFNNDSVPNLYPSNKALRCSAAVLEDGTEVLLTKPKANELNGIGVVTAFNLNGWKAWGNNTAAYPDITTDPKDRWIGCRRFFSWWGNSFITTYLSKVDDLANYRLIESIIDSENVRANSLVSTGKCAGLRMEYRKADNPIGNVIDGKIVFRQYLAPYTPAEDILNILEFDPAMIETALGGESA